MPQNRMEINLQRLVLSFGLLMVAGVCIPCSVRGENWPGWRGPRGDGTSLEQNVPVQWDGQSGQNVLWNVPLSGQGHASPVLWDDTIFLVSCYEESRERVLLCFDRYTGKTRWQRTVLRGPLETKHTLNSFASSTPVTDGKSVFVTFLEVDGRTIPAPNVSRTRPVTPGRVVVAAYDFQGNRQWLVRPGGFVSAHGFCSSPVLHQDLVIVNGDHDGNSYIVALDKSTGETVWKTPREHKTRSYVTPIIRTIGGHAQLVLSGSMCVKSLDPRDGSAIWKVDGPTEQFVASMVFDGTLFYLAAGYPTYHVMGIRPDGQGNVTDTHVAWHVTNARCYVPSPVVVDNYLVVADDRGTASCFAAATGRRLWQERLGKRFGASLVTAGGLVYFLADDGVTKIVRPGTILHIVAENKLDDNFYASPAVSQGRIYLRGEKQLYCLGAKEVSVE